MNSWILLCGFALMCGITEEHQDNDLNVRFCAGKKCPNTVAPGCRCKTKTLPSSKAPFSKTFHAHSDRSFLVGQGIKWDIRNLF